MDGLYIVRSNGLNLWEQVLPKVWVNGDSELYFQQKDVDTNTINVSSVSDYSYYFQADMNEEGFVRFSGSYVHILGDGGMETYHMYDDGSPQVELLWGDDHIEVWSDRYYDAGDMNGDGFNEIVLREIYYEDDGFAYEFVDGSLRGTYLHSDAELSRIKSAHSMVSLGDHDGDGYNDMVVRCRNTAERESVVYGPVIGIVECSDTHSVITAGNLHAALDLTGDGRPELVYTQRLPGVDGLHLSVLEGPVRGVVDGQHMSWSIPAPGNSFLSFGMVGDVSGEGVGDFNMVFETHEGEVVFSTLDPFLMFQER